MLAHRNSPPIRLLLTTLVVDGLAVVVNGLCDVAIWVLARRPGE